MNFEGRNERGHSFDFKRSKSEHKHRVIELENRPGAEKGK